MTAPNGCQKSSVGVTRPPITPAEDPAQAGLARLGRRQSGRAVVQTRSIMPLSEQELRHVAKLARLTIPDDQLHQHSQRLAAILDFVQRIGEVDVSGVEPMAHPLPLHNVLREDTPGDPLPLEQVLLNAPESDGAFFKVPKVIGGDEE
jgi:aspartyl-tRNA(Asn)/glutamyl-tRNA(Gln) amidotransferase subunit C